jgi:hypothetical protein
MKRMKRMNFNWRNLAAIVACLAVTTMFSGCGPEDDPDNGTNTPGAVIDFTATAGDGQVSLTWTVPYDNGGSEITGYEVTMDAWTNKVSKTANELSHTYTGLTNGTWYTFKVRAVNASGAGAESTAEARPQASGGGTLGAWSIPENNWKVVFYHSTHNSQVTIIKVGNNYYIKTPTARLTPHTEEFYWKYNPATEKWTIWRKHPNINNGNWAVQSVDNTFGKDELRNRQEGLYVGLLSARQSVINRPVIGSGEILGRSVEIRATQDNVNKVYIDTEHKLVLKGTSYDGGNVMVELKIWDEAITNFDGIDLPE